MKRIATRLLPGASRLAAGAVALLGLHASASAATSNATGKPRIISANLKTTALVTLAGQNVADPTNHGRPDRSGRFAH